MVEVTIRIESVAVGDQYPRSHGLAIDTHLEKTFWSTQSSTVIGISAGTFKFSKTVNLDTGNHTVEYGVSAWVGKWEAEIYANDRLIAKGDVSRDNIAADQYLQGAILIGPLGNVLPALKIPAMLPSLPSLPMVTTFSSKISGLRVRAAGMRTKIFGRFRR